MNEPRTVWVLMEYWPYDTQQIIAVSEKPDRLKSKGHQMQAGGKWAQIDESTHRLNTDEQNYSFLYIERHDLI